MENLSTMLTIIKHKIYQRFLPLKNQRNDNKNTQTLPLTNNDASATNCGQQKRLKIVENVVGKSSSSENGGDGEAIKVEMRIEGVMPKLYLFKFPSWLNKSNIDMAQQCEHITDIAVNHNLHTTLATMWAKLQQHKAKFTADESAALKGLFERQLEATKEANDLIVDMQISHGNALIEKATNAPTITTITTICALDFSDKFELIYVAPCLDKNTTTSTLQKQLAVQHLDEEPIIAMPTHTRRQLGCLKVLIMPFLLLLIPAYFWNLFSALYKEPEAEQEEAKNAMMKWFGGFCLFFQCAALWNLFAENNLRIYKLASALPKEALHIQTRRLWLAIAILAALCAYPMLKQWLALGPLFNYILPQMISILCLSTFAYAILLAFVGCAAELCVQKRYLAKYQQQLERNKAAAQPECAQADSLRAILDGMSHREAMMLQKFFQFYPNGLSH